MIRLTRLTRPLSGRDQVLRHVPLAWTTQGDTVAEDVIDRVRVASEGKKTVMVTLDSGHHAVHVAKEMEAYCPLVSVGSYCIVEVRVVIGAAFRVCVAWHRSFCVIIFHNPLNCSLGHQDVPMAFQWAPRGRQGIPRQAPRVPGEGRMCAK